MQELDDMELVKQAQRGNSTAVGELYDRHRQRIFRYIQAKTRHTDIAQDLTGEVFLRMVDHLPHFQPMGVPFSAWLYRIANNIIIKHGQKEDQQPVVPLGYAHMDTTSNNPASIVEKQIQIEKMMRSLEKIDENQREVVILRFIVGLSLQETADTVQKSVANIKTLQHRGILALQAALSAEKQGV